MAIETEDKFDVPVDFEIPDLADALGCAQGAGPASFRLIAWYFDTPDLRLAAQGITLRWRRGGEDSGWHLKLPKAEGVREEITCPLTQSDEIVPHELTELVQVHTRGARLVPVAEVETRRKATRLRDAEDRVLLEIADDQVKGTVFGDAFGERRQVEHWREVEAELVGGDARVLKRAGKLLRQAGATPAGSASKLARLLGSRIPALVRGEQDDGTAGQVVVGYLRSQVAALLTQDPRVRRSEYDAVHKMRVASRRLRSALKSFSTVVAADPDLRDELRWIAAVLGEARDLEVIRERFAGHLETLDPALVVGPVRTRLGDDLADRERAALARVSEAMTGERYFALLDRLDALVADPPLTPLAGKKAEKTLARFVAGNWKRVVRAYDEAQAVEDADQREIAMHEVRKAAKRARYTAEALRPLLGRDAAEAARRARAVQEVLGLYQDGVVAQRLLLDEARRAGEAGEDTFTYGVLVGLERAAAERSHAEFPAVWDAATAG